MTVSIGPGWSIGPGVALGGGGGGGGPQSYSVGVDYSNSTGDGGLSVRYSFLDGGALLQPISTYWTNTAGFNALVASPNGSTGTASIGGTPYTFTLTSSFTDQGSNIWYCNISGDLATYIGSNPQIGLNSIVID
jgi:hypothetical protein